MSIQNALSALGLPSRDPSLTSRHLTEVDGGALCARPYRVSANKYVGQDEAVDAIFLHYLQSLKPGGGTRALKRLIEIADAIQVPIVLSPTGYSTPLRPVPLTKDELTAYYTRFGFQSLEARNPGKWTNTLLIRRPS